MKERTKFFIRLLILGQLVVGAVSVIGGLILRELMSMDLDIRGPLAILISIILLAITA